MQESRRRSSGGSPCASATRVSDRLARPYAGGPRSMTMMLVRRITHSWLAAPVLAVTILSLAVAQDSSSGEAIKLKSLNWTRFKERLAADKDVKFTLVDVWATTCGPCKENFPHLVEMHRKYASKGLGVVSLTLDDPTDAKAVEAAEKF